MECLSGSLHKQEYWTKLWQSQSRPSSNCHFGRWRSSQISSHGVKHVFPRGSNVASHVLKRVSMEGNQSWNAKSLSQVTWIYFSAKRAWVIQRKTCSSGRRWLLLAGGPSTYTLLWACRVARCRKMLQDVARIHLPCKSVQKSWSSWKPFLLLSFCLLEFRSPWSRYVFGSCLESPSLHRSWTKSISPLGRLNDFGEISTLTVVHEDAQPAMFVQAVPISNNIGMLKGLSVARHAQRSSFAVHGVNKSHSPKPSMEVEGSALRVLHVNSCASVLCFSVLWFDSLPTQSHTARSLLSLIASSSKGNLWKGKRDGQRQVLPKPQKLQEPSMTYQSQNLQCINASTIFIWTHWTPSHPDSRLLDSLSFSLRSSRSSRSWVSLEEAALTSTALHTNLVPSSACTSNALPKEPGDVST